MNLLVVSEKFLNGGVETQIYTQFSTMKKDIKFVFAFGEYKSKLSLDGSKIYTNFSFSMSSSIVEFCNDVDRLVDIINKEKIDVIHVHPFYSIFPTIIAAQITNTPIVYTVHGYMSLNFATNINDTILFYYALENLINKAFCVSIKGVEALNSQIMHKRAVYLPNAIDVEKYRKNSIVNNKNWALISRISEDKLEDIKKMLSVIEKVDIEKICVYGSGESKQELEEFIKEKKLEDKVILRGHTDNLKEELENSYNGIIGMGRSIMEGIAMGYPILLCGYGKISGIVDEDLYSKIKDINFINRDISEISLDKLKEQIKNVYSDSKNSLYENFIKEFSAETINKKYINEISNIKSVNNLKIVEMYNEIKKNIQYKENIYQSKRIYEIIKKYIQSQSLMLLMNSLFCNYDKYFELIDINEELKKKINEELDIKIRGINNEILHLKENDILLENSIRKTHEKDMMLIQKRLDIIEKNEEYIESKINVKYLLINTLKKIKKKILREEE